MDNKEPHPAEGDVHSKPAGVSLSDGAETERLVLLEIIKRNTEKYMSTFFYIQYKEALC